MSGTTGHLTCALFGSKAARQLNLPWRAAELASGSSGGSPKSGAGNARPGRGWIRRRFFAQCASGLCGIRWNSSAS